ncbi:Transcriptional regulator, MerR family [Streptomyces venezuelae]|uniref:MerR family transcriptional regulator n=1 Tax=Streptomyces gardneri TaxID=66892 RepID=UPI0006BD9021|nr:MerR family transcriptional regulator [Streptomyces gardneri]ALO10583.1 Transcriptional regulator, MerR family [Streptomyces venezuelae]QPK47573.1 MerR family transcriptional regulator [Streptomyces gardneri]WRK39014.1 MerR family transcriptional regulator [Streptomyces venezuelae]CUM38945.1 Transcriptional regulator, MerR family [Streptomyces venezuelae]
MFIIGDFARHGRVSVRMLRHYDAIGLLRPARVDPHSGYRFYTAEQLARLNRVIALKDLGFTLEQVGSILDEQIDADELRGMLRLRQAELEAALEAARARLNQVGARLRAIETEGRMSTQDVVVKKIPAVRIAELSTVAASFGPHDIGPAIGPLYDELCGRLEAAGVTGFGPGIAYYEDAGKGDGSVLVHAGMTVPEGTVVEGVEVHVLPGIEQAATIVHRGSMDSILPTVQTLARWMETNGYESEHYARELYLECPEDRSQWVTEIQEAIVRA